MSISTKQVIGDPLIINGRKLSLSRAIRAGDFVFLAGQIPIKDGIPMTSGTIEEQTRACLDSIRETLSLAGCELADVVKSISGLALLDRQSDEDHNRSVLTFIVLVV